MSKSITDCAIDDLTEKRKDGTLNQLCEQFQEQIAHFDTNKPLHVLFIGRGRSGKTALSKFLTTGKSQGTAGPRIGTKYITTREEKHNNIVYVIHDTKGIGDVTSDFRELREEIREVYQKHKEECIVILCINQNTRVTDHGNSEVFLVCDYLDKDIWKNVIICVTHSEVPMDCQDVEGLKKDWEAKIEQLLKTMRVQPEVPICFTGHTSVQAETIVKNWKKDFITTIYKKANDSDAYSNLVVQSCINAIEINDISYNDPVIEYAGYAVPNFAPTGGNGVPVGAPTGDDDVPTGGNGVPVGAPTGDDDVSTGAPTGGNGVPVGAPTEDDDISTSAPTGGNGVPVGAPTGGNDVPVGAPTGGNGVPVGAPTGCNAILGGPSSSDQRPGINIGVAVVVGGAVIKAGFNIDPETAVKMGELAARLGGPVIQHKKEIVVGTVCISVVAIAALLIWTWWKRSETKKNEQAIANDLC